ncbi:hypothetical protein [Bradyrhizobium sp. AZCC 2230]|uniref:hypothetical protein n=1 Tax=Bradyrhizobium sp. AZCC 2230 TaxID=3117021 RepID=UPI002FF2152E
MIEADPRVSTPPLNSSASNIIDLSARRASRPAVLPPENVADVQALPYSVTRRIIHSRKPRRSKNGTPEERAAKAQAPAVVASYSGVPLRMPAQGGDDVYIRIAEHREAAAIFDRCVDAENDAEGKVTREEFARLHRATARACDEMMFAARCLILSVPTTRTGLARWTTYLRKLLIDWDGCTYGSPYLPEKINGKPWIDRFLLALTMRLRKMGDEFPTEKRKRSRKDAPTFDQFVGHLRGFLNHHVLEEGKTIDQALDLLRGGTLAGLEARNRRPQQ